MCRRNSEDKRRTLAVLTYSLLRTSAATSSIPTDPASAETCIFVDTVRSPLSPALTSNLIHPQISAGLDETVFPSPTEILLDRPENSYVHHGAGPHAALGRSIATTALTSQLRVFAHLNGLRRAPGPQGEMKYKQGLGGRVYKYMKED
ncbi:MAG: hypothetical protein M1829_003298 [Trizodia sp. TS-e1964]|nr:MAG: hypothetical protein M1829_003298 [Trizodia sp. TS-e1964]